MANAIKIDDFLTIEALTESASSRSRIDAILSAVREHLGMDVAFSSEFRDGKRVFRHVDAAVEPAPLAIGGADPLEDSYCMRVVDGRLPRLIRNAALVPEAAGLPVTHLFPIGAHLSVPIRLSDGSVYGTFCCFSTTPDETLTDRDLHVLEAFADLAAEQIDRDLKHSRRTARIREKVRAAIAHDSIRILYQPIVSLSDARVLGFEALARFPDAASRSPAEWFDEARRAGVSVELEMAAVAAALSGRARLPKQQYLSLNLSPETVASGNLLDLFSSTEESPLVIEITEHSIIDDYQRVRTALEPLRRFARVAVDDVGAGYAGLRHILDIAPDIIKLDVGLVQGIDHDPARCALASALVTFAENTGSRLVAEGIETEAELKTLRALGVHAGQGYLLSRPLEIEQAMACERIATALAD